MVMLPREEAMAREAMEMTESLHLADRTRDDAFRRRVATDVQLARVLVQIGLEKAAALRCLMLDEPISNL